MKNWFRDIEWGQLIAMTILIGLILLFMVAIYGAIVSSQIESQCLAHGFSSGGMTLNFYRYCARTINQTDYVCSFKNVLANQCQLPPPR